MKTFINIFINIHPKVLKLIISLISHSFKYFKNIFIKVWKWIDRLTKTFTFFYCKNEYSNFTVPNSKMFLKNISYSYILYIFIIHCYLLVNLTG